MPFENIAPFITSGRFMNQLVRSYFLRFIIKLIIGLSK